MGTVRATAAGDGATVKAYAGSTGVIVAMDVEPARREGLLGFALRRQVGRGRRTWLKSMLQFPGVAHTDGERTPTDRAPVQKFRWSDYGVFPGTSYRYTVHPVYGTPDRLERGDPMTVAVRTSDVAKGDSAVLFNRAAAASQAFSRDFPEAEAAVNRALAAGEKPSELPADALEWLSRGLLEQIVGFLAQATDDRWALDVAIYEYELPAIAEAVEAAVQRGVQVRVVYHAKRGDHQTEVNRAALRGLPEEVLRARVTSGIFHHKFVVLSRLNNGVRKAQAVLCGSTNFTANGVYRQANVVHVVRRPATAGQFLALFEVLFGGADRAATRDFITGANPLPADGEAPPLFASFTPRPRTDDLAAVVKIIDDADRDVLFCTAFGLDDSVLDALLGAEHDEVLRFGLQNARSRITGVHRDRTASFTATAMLKKGLEGFLAESTRGQRGNILIHTKLVVTDFTSDSPTVVSGSHNLSPSASKNNDENLLMVRGDTDVADCYGVELMRLYDHYRFRFAVRGGAGPPSLTPDDSWTERYFREGSLNSLDRLRFAGR